MARVRNLLAVVGIALLASAACGGDSSSTAPTPAQGLSNGSMTATVDGVPWFASRFLTVQYQPNVGPFLIMGSDSLGTVISLSTPAYQTGNFSACSGSLACSFLSLQTSINTWSAGLFSGSSGTLFLSVLTTHNTVGTFSFVGVGADGTKKTVTNGAFSITY